MKQSGVFWVNDLLIARHFFDNIENSRIVDGTNVIWTWVRFPKQMLTEGTQAKITRGSDFHPHR